MVEFANHIGCLLGISSYIMGLVVLAAGTSIPDTLSSVMVAKRGLGAYVLLWRLLFIFIKKKKMMITTTTTATTTTKTTTGGVSCLSLRPSVACLRACVTVFVCEPA
jgi:hypothetical protein